MKAELYEKLRSRIDVDADIYKGSENPDYNQFNSAEKIAEHINSVMTTDTNKVAEIKPLSIGVTYPDNDSDPYKHDIYEVTLVNGIKFKVHRSCGRPNWSGNVAFCNSLDVVYESN